jgi:hypothetical protein
MGPHGLLRGQLYSLYISKSNFNTLQNALYLSYGDKLVNCVAGIITVYSRNHMKAISVHCNENTSRGDLLR